MPVGIVTGASRGLGLALARELAKRGWTLVARGAEALQSAAAGLNGVVPVPGDMSATDHRRALVEAAGDRIDLVVSNASLLGPSPQPRLAEYPLDELARVYEVNVFAPLALVQLALPRLAPNAAIVHVISDAAVEPYEGWGGYGSSKAALEQLTAIHAALRDLPRFLEPGDLLVVNTSATLPAAVPAGDLELRLSTQIAPGRWLVELRTKDGDRFRGGREGDRIPLPEGRGATLLARHAGRRLWLAQLEVDDAYLRRHGRPISYGYVPHEWPIEAYQTVFSLEPGSAETPSGGRPLTTEPA